MSNKPVPIPLAMVICDTVIQDKKTGKKTLVGLFNNVGAKKVPVIHPSLNVYIILTEGTGNYDGKLKCVVDDDIVLEMGGPLVFKHPHQIAEWNFNLRNLPLPKFGDYRFEFYCNEELVLSRKFKVSEMKKER